MNYYISRVYESVVNKTTKLGLLLFSSVCFFIFFYAGIFEYVGIHVLIALTFYPPAPLISIFFLGIFFVEGSYVHSYMPFIICRRRLDVPEAPWESFETFILDYDEYESTEFFDFHNSFYSNDGFCPRSFAEMDTPYEFVLGERIKSITHINEFFKYVLPRMGNQFNKEYTQSLTFPTIRDSKQLRSIYGNTDRLLFRLKFWYGGSLLDRAPQIINEFENKIVDDFERPTYFISPFNINWRDDFQELGVSLVSGSAEDSSSYIYEVEQPQIFSQEHILNSMPMFDPDLQKITVKPKQGNFFGMRNMGTFMANTTIPETFSYNNNYELLDEYPVNINKFYMKRDWEENPDALTFRDPFTGNYSNLTRFTSSAFKLDLKAFKHEFFLIHKLPRMVRPDRRVQVRSLNIEFLNRNVALIQKHININRFIAPEFTRFGWVSYLQNLIISGLKYYVMLDRDRSYRMHSGLPGELEIVPTGNLFNYMNKYFHPKKALLKQLYSRLVLDIRIIINKYNILSHRVIYFPYWLFVTILSYILFFLGFKRNHYNIKQWTIIRDNTNNESAHTKKQVSILVWI